MRLEILNSGHGFLTKTLFAIIRTASRQPVLEVIKLVKYRPDFYAKKLQAITQDAMRGPSPWSVPERELMAAVVANANSCQWCTKAHSEVAKAGYGNDSKVSAALANLDTAEISEPLRATLKLLRKLCRENTVTQNDMRVVLAAGASPQQIEDALGVCFAFNVTGRLADAFGFEMASEGAFQAGAKYLLARGYR